MWRFLVFFIIVLNINYTEALGVSDFVPKFLLPKSNPATQNNNETTNNVNNNNSLLINGNSTDYCNNGQLMSSSSVFCTNKQESYNFGGDGTISADNSSVLVPKNQAIPTPSANQDALQDQGLKNAMNKYKSNYSLSLQPNDNVKMDVGINQLELNIKY